MSAPDKDAAVLARVKGSRYRQAELARMARGAEQESKTEAQRIEQMVVELKARADDLERRVSALELPVG